jgi:hypothetical protein
LYAVGDVNFDAGVVIKLQREKWVFRNIVAAGQLRIYDYDAVVDMIGTIREWLGPEQVSQPAQ